MGLLLNEPLLKATAQEVIEFAKNYVESFGREISSLPREQYLHYIRTFAEQYWLEERELKKLASHLNIQWYPPDITIPYSYVPSICFENEGIKYTNPEDIQEFTIFCSSKSVFGVECVLKHTKNGYQDTSYFTHFVPLLTDVWSNYQSILKSTNFSNQTLKKRDDILRRFQEQYINSPLNKEYKEGMCLTKHQVIHLFFNQYMPGFKGICSRCFYLSLPLKGFGARWKSKEIETSEVIYRQELRLSVPKMNSTYDSHKILYVTHELDTGLDEVLHVSFEGVHYTPQKDWKGKIIESQVCYDQIQTQKFDLISNLNNSKIERSPSIHIPYDVYNNCYLKLIQQFPNITKQEYRICQCQK